jgi:class 3 adenylate cyclase
VPPERDIRGSIGIGFGETLIIGQHDMFGPEMNLACKLGEDVAATKEILLTEAAYSALPEKTYVCEPASVTISGMELKAFRFVRKA